MAITVNGSAFSTTSLEAPTHYESRWQVWASGGLMLDTWYAASNLTSFTYDNPFAGSFQFRVQYRDNYGVISDWSEMLTVTVAGPARKRRSVVGPNHHVPEPGETYKRDNEASFRHVIERSLEGLSTRLSEVSELAGAVKLLARVSYNPSVLTLVSTTSTTLVDMDATNLVITFVAPNSGKVRIALYGLAFILVTSGTHAIYWGLREGSGVVSKSRWQLLADGFIDNNIQFRASYAAPFEGLTPGKQYTWKWAQAVSSGGTASLGYGATGEDEGLYGPAVMEVWEVVE